jgi:hypothetical protein
VPSLVLQQQREAAMAAADEEAPLVEAEEEAAAAPPPPPSAGGARRQSSSPVRGLVASARGQGTVERRAQQHQAAALTPPELGRGAAGPTPARSTPVLGSGGAANNPQRQAQLDALRAVLARKPEPVALLMPRRPPGAVEGVGLHGTPVLVAPAEGAALTPGGGHNAAPGAGGAGPSPASALARGGARAPANTPAVGLAYPSGGAAGSAAAWAAAAGGTGTGGGGYGLPPPVVNGGGAGAAGAAGAAATFAAPPAYGGGGGHVTPRLGMAPVVAPVELPRLTPATAAALARSQQGRLSGGQQQQQQQQAAGAAGADAAAAAAGAAPRSRTRPLLPIENLLDFRSQPCGEGRFQYTHDATGFCFRMGPAPPESPSSRAAAAGGDGEEGEEGGDGGAEEEEVEFVPVRLGLAAATLPDFLREAMTFGVSQKATFVRLLLEALREATEHGQGQQQENAAAAAPPASAAKAAARSPLPAAAAAGRA